MDEVTTRELDELSAELRDAVDRDREIEALSKDSKMVLATLKESMMTLLEKAGKTQYKAEGVGLCVIKKKMSVTTPKDADSKKEFFNWIKEKFGEIGFWSYVSINSQTLNSLYNEQLEQAEDPSTFVVAGLAPAVEYKQLSFTKK
jgi:hypothetical protein